MLQEKLSAQKEYPTPPYLFYSSLCVSLLLFRTKSLLRIRIHGPVESGSAAGQECVVPCSVLLVLILLVFVVLRKLHCAPCAKSAQHHGRGPPADLVSVFFFCMYQRGIEDDNRTGRLCTLRGDRQCWGMGSVTFWCNTGSNSILD